MSHGHPLDRYIGDAYPDLEDPRAVAAFERIPYDERIAVQSTYEALRVGASLAPDEPAIHFLLRGEPEEEPLTLTYRQYLGRVSQTASGFCALTSANSGKVTSLSNVMSNSPAPKPNMRVLRLGTIFQSMASRYGRPFFQ